MDRALKDKIERLQDLRRQHDALQQAAKVPLVRGPADRAIPNSIIRSALFNILRHHGPRLTFRQQVVAAWGQTKIIYTGEALDQNDLEVWAQLIKLAGQSITDQQQKCIVRVSKREFARLLGQTSGGKQLAKNDEAIERLERTSVKIKDGRFMYVGGLIHDILRNDHSELMAVELNTKLAVLFRPDSFTWVDFNQRMQLSGDLTRWLHSFFSSHTDEFTQFTIEQIKDLCGSQTRESRRFRQMLKTSLANLVDVGFLKTFSVGRIYLKIERQH